MYVFIKDYDTSEDASAYLYAWYLLHSKFPLSFEGPDHKAALPSVSNIEEAKHHLEA